MIRNTSTTAPKPQDMMSRKDRLKVREAAFAPRHGGVSVHDLDQAPVGAAQGQGVAEAQRPVADVPAVR
jgi:hypothetical protein